MTCASLRNCRKAEREITMRVLIAGASGAIGRPLVRRLRANQHEVFAVTQSRDSAPALKENGAEAVIANALETRTTTAPRTWDEEFATWSPEEQEWFLAIP